MPDPNQVQDIATHQRAFSKAIIQKTVEDHPKSELGELRKEIAELKKILNPKPSVILTGQRVIDEYWEITKCVKQGDPVNARR